ncbi:anti-sigma factor antagonist [Streptomyces sp. UH6]|uniref:anti-sigma factor antagonist n=1 Tax=Streptomyces sp. UH6 TaxID=2748379 RepID=UPI0015D4C6D6|nr:anti-sigma factor antagonist [Streptomyces sp. UH6]NYV78646.1 anti-sigma factor antagonist [Streptomyces sp. UH6]
MRQEPAPLTRHLRVREHQGHTVLELRGEIDILTAQEVGPHLDAVTGRARPDVVIDLTPVEFFDCSGLRLLFRARRRVLARGGELRVVCADRLVLRILRVTGLAAVLPVAPSMEEALRAPSPRAASGAG